MKLSDHLKDDQRQQLIGKGKPKKNKKDEHIDWHDMMGSNRAIYKRVKGAIRRK
ncbi:hypothetical protein ACQCT5_10400 [Sutcliffiella halmapala]